MLYSRLEPSTVNALAVRDGEVHAKVLGDTLAMTVSVASDGGYIRLDSLSIAPGPAFVAQGAVQNFSLQDLGYLDAQLTGSFDVAAAGSTIQAMTIHHASIAAGVRRLVKCSSTG